MRRFVATVFDDWVYADSTYTSDAHQELLGSVDQLAIQVTANAVSDSVALTVAFESSSDGIKWFEHSLPIEGEVLLAGRNNVAVGVVSTTTAMGRVRLRVELAGTDPQGRVRLIVCGRDREHAADSRSSMPEGIVASRNTSASEALAAERRAGTLPDAMRPHRGTKTLEQTIR